MLKIKKVAKMRIFLVKNNTKSAIFNIFSIFCLIFLFNIFTKKF